MHQNSNQIQLQLQMVDAVQIVLINPGGSCVDCYLLR